MITGLFSTHELVGLLVPAGPSGSFRQIAKLGIMLDVGGYVLYPVQYDDRSYDVVGFMRDADEVIPKSWARMVSESGKPLPFEFAVPGEIVTANAMPTLALHGELVSVKFENKDNLMRLVFLPCEAMPIRAVPA